MKKYLIVIICLLSASCYHPNKQWYEDRDTIHFKDSVEEVEANIIKLNSLFDKIRKEYNDSIYIHYRWDYKDTNIFYLCDTAINRLDQENIYKNILVKSLSKEEKNELIEKIYYLKENFLTSGRYIDGGYYYDYRYIDEDHYFSRDIFYFGDNVDTSRMYSAFRFLDRKGNLMLIKFKD